MMPVCSASGMNPSGPMHPSCGWFQRTSASSASVAPPWSGTFGW